MDPKFAVKFADGSDDVVEGYGLPFGGPHNGRDLAGEYFSAKTDFALDWFGANERPLLYHHGLDEDAGISVVGRVKSVGDADELGRWTSAQLDKASKFYTAIRKLVADGKLSFSSGSMSHLVEKTKRGEIKQWPFIELSLTPTPCNLSAVATLAAPEVTKRFSAIGVELDETVAAAIKADLTAAQRDKLKDASFAYIDSKGNRHLPIHDAVHVRAALARFDQTEFESEDAKKAAYEKILAAAKRFGVDVSDDDKAKVKAFLGKVAYRAALKAAGMADDDDGSDSSTSSEGEKGEPVDGEQPGDERPEGSYEDLIGDLNRSLQAAFGADYDCCVYVVATFPDHCIACVYSYGPPENAASSRRSGDYYRVEYTLGTDGEPLLGSMTKVQRVYTAKSALELPPIDEAPLAIQSARLSSLGSTIVQRTQDLVDRRAKEGRVLSDSNRERLHENVKATEDVLSALKALLEPATTLSNAAAATAEGSSEASAAAKAAAPVVSDVELDLLELEAFAATL